MKADQRVVRPDREAPPEASSFSKSDRTQFYAEYATAAPVEPKVRHHLDWKTIEATTDSAALGAMLIEHHADPSLAGSLAMQLWRHGAEDSVAALKSYIEAHAQDQRHSAGIASAVRTIGALSNEGGIEPQAAAEILLPLIGSKTEEVRLSALSTLAADGHPEALRALDRVRGNGRAPINDRLLALQYSGADYQRSLERLLKAEDITPATTAQILWELNGREGSRGSRAVELVISPKTNPELRSNLLLYGPNDERSIPAAAIISACTSTDAQLAFGGAFAARSRSQIEGPSILRQALTAPALNSSARGLILNGLAEMASPDDRAAFTPYLADPNTAEGRAALTYFSKVDPAAAVEQARAVAAGGERIYSKAEAFGVLAAAGSSFDAAAILEAAPKMSPYSDLPVVVAALERTGQRDLIEQLGKVIDDDAGRRLILHSLARLGDETAVEEILKRPAARGERGEDFAVLAASGTATGLRAIFHELGDARTVIRTPLAQSLHEPKAFNRFVSALSATGDPALITWADDIVQARLRDIHHPLRLRPSDLHAVIETQRTGSRAAPHDRQALVILPQSDHNNAFNGTAPVIESLRERGYRVVLFEAATEDQVIAALKSHQRFGASDAVIFGAHGAKETMSFGGFDPRLGQENDERLTIERGDQAQLLDPAVGAALKPGGRVILFSCSTGEGGKTAKNLGSFMRQVFPDAARDGIAAPPIPVRGGVPLRFDKAGLPIQPDHPWVIYSLSDNRTLGKAASEEV